MGRNKKERKKLKAEKIRNRKLCQRYPFLIPHNAWTGKVVWKQFKDVSKYEYTELDCMEPGWRKAFGIQMCEDIREQLIKYGFLYKYRILQIKEKFGELCWYDAGIPVGAEAIWDVIEDYSEVSRHTCYICGAPAEVEDDGGWLITMCPKCRQKMEERRKKDQEN